MKASVSPAAVIFAVLILASGSQMSRAQDVVVQKNDGQRREGQILGVKADSVRIKIGPAETGIPMSNVTSVTMAPPKAYSDALTFWQSGDAAKTLTVLGPLMENFNGLPTDWAQRASALLGDVYLATSQTDKAEAAFATFQKLFSARRCSCSGRSRKPRRKMPTHWKTTFWLSPFFMRTTPWSPKRTNVRMPLKKKM